MAKPKKQIKSPSAREYDRESYILIVDDDETLLKFFKIHLNKFFSRVIVVKDAKEALATLKQKQIDLVLSDMRMPRVDGLQLLKKIRQQDPAIPVLLISGAMLDDEVLQEIKNGADGFLKKPFTVEEIHKFIDAGMNRRDLLKKLSSILSDAKTIATALASGKADAKIKSKTDREEVQNILDQLRAAS